MRLDIHNLESGYGRKQVLFGASLTVDEGEIVALIGPNGAGKSTILKVVCGLLPVWRGEIRLDGLPSNDSTPVQNVSRGISFAPQGNRIFAGLSVQENIELGGSQLSKQELQCRINGMYEFFPILKDRARQTAGKLSGGEQQVLALARALIMRPRLLMLDEPSLGLSPNLILDVLEKIKHIRDITGAAVLIVEQKVREVLVVSDRVYALRLGRVAFSGESKELVENNSRLKELFL